jgi:hypothetical protein
MHVEDKSPAGEVHYGAKADRDSSIDVHLLDTMRPPGVWPSWITLPDQESRRT